ncbi:K02A2.6-like, partial [Cordylochernes scorpioides]
MELNQDSIGVKSDGPTKTTEERQEVRETGETTAPLADVVTQLSTLLTRAKVSDGAEATIPPFDGTYSAIQFFQAFDRKMEDASMGEQEKLLRLPNYLVRQPLELFRKLRLADRSYFKVRQILLDLYPESSEASFAKYFAMKLTGQANLETYNREKTAMGLQLGLPQEVILETLTEGLPFNDQRLVRVVPPENLGEWFRLVQRIHGPSVPTTRSREDQPPTMSGPYHSTPRRPGAWNALMILLKHFNPKTNIIYERFVFQKMDQKSGETISKYIIRLKEQAQRCNFGDVLQESLRDRFVAGIIDTPTQKKLLQEEGLTFEGALDIALSAESADNDLHNLKRSEDAHLSPQHLHAINNPCKHCGNCLFYMPSNNKATTALTCKKPAQNMPIQQDNSHTKHIGDHTSSHNYHMTKPHNELDTPIDTQQNPLPHAYYNTTSNTRYTPQFTTLLQRYTHTFTQNKFNVPCLRIPPVKIPTNSDKIITIRPYRVPICDQQEIRHQVQQMLENGIIEQSFSPFSSPVTLVTKRDKTKRFCIDYRKVNELISSDVHPLPRIEDILDRLAQAKYFSTADISSAYWQVPIHPDSRPLLAFATLEGLYQPTRLPFGLKTSPQIYERAISQVLQRHGLDCVAHYFDDFIIYSNTLEEHQNHLRQFFAFCEAEKLQLNFVKCEFFKQSIDFLGYTITAGTITPLTRNTDIIHAIKQPHNRKTLQSFLGTVNVYNKFIPEYARLRAPLNNLLKKDVVWNWNEVCQEAFVDLKGNLTQHPILHLYKEGLPCQVYCDASTLGIAGILKQVHPDGNVYPVQYFSRTLRPHEKNYSISELECLAIVESVEKFRIYLMGRKFTIFSDHHALQWLKTIKNPSGRLFRWSLRLSSYEYEVRYIKGKLQYEADLLSRNPFCGFLDATLIKTHQPPPSKESSLTIDRNGLHTVSRKGVTKIIIPKPLIQQLLQTVHTQYNHPGISQMSRLISTQYYWQGMSKDIKQKVKTCPTCQLTKRPLGPTYGELSQPPEAKEPFDLLYLDTIAGFAKYGNTKIYLHVVVDHFSRYAWTYPSKSISIITYQQVLKRVLQDGSPKRLLTDRAPAFTSPKFRSFLLNRNIYPLLTTSNNPQANGLCERLNATLTGKLRLLHLENPKIAWTKLVKRVTIIYNKTPHSTTGFPPIYLMFGILPPEISNHGTPYPDIDKARKIAHIRTQNKHLQDKNIYDQRHKQPHFEVGDLVLVKLYHHPNTGKLAPYFTGPHTVLEIISPNVVRIDRPNQPLQRDNDTIHVNKLKLYTETIRYISPPAKRIKWRRRINVSMATTNLNYPRFREGEDLNCYLEQLEECFKLNKTLEADKVSVLLTSIDVNVYKTLRDLLVPRRPSDLKYKDLVEVLTNHLYPIKNKHYERYLFHKIVQKENEPVGKFVLRLKSQADKCKFTDINENLCDQFVSGCFDEATLKRLLSEPFLTFDSAINIANSVEAAKSQVNLMKNPGHDIDKLKARSKNFKFPCKYNNPCKICGKSNHDTKLCKFKNAQCYICNKKGHIAPVCWNKKSAQNSGMNKPNQNKLNTFQCNTLENAPKIMVNVKIEDADTIMEVDTGADVSVVSKKFFLTNLKNVTLEKYSGHLKSFSGNLIPVFGKCLVNVSYKNYQEKLPLIVTGQFNNQTPLLGRNWIRILKADWPNCVFDICNNINVISNLELFLEVYKRVFENKDLPIQGIKGSISLRPNAKPKFFKFRPVPFSIKEKIDKELDRLEKSQIIEKVNASDWSTPLVTVIKSNGELRLCGDFKNTLNNCIEDEKYPLPTIETMLGNLGGNKIFTKLDLSSAYHQIEMDEASKNLLVVSTHRGLYRYNRLPFGISPASAIFQRCMDSLFHDVPNTVIYLDDIFIGSKDEQEHYRILKMIFDKLKELNFTLNKEKCLFKKKDICFLGHIINEDGVRPDSKKLEALERCKKPFDKTSLKSFLGMLSFYSKYIPNMSTLAGPLYQLLKKDNRWKWSSQCEKAFLNLKLTLLNSQALIHYSMKLPLTLTCDASAYGISGVLCHIVEGEEKPITFVSRTLSSAEVKYSQTEKEALAIVFATSKLKQYLFGRKFVLKSDHKALTTVFGNKRLLPPLIANRLHRWALELSNFDFDIRYTNKDTMLCADAFSRLPLEEINSREDNIDLGCIFVDSRAVIPRTCQDQMLKLLHQSHIGINRMKSLARSSVWWPKMDSQIEEFVKECSPCMHHQTAPPAENTPWPRTNQPWQRVHVDHFYFRGDCYLLVVDANSNWIEVFPVRGTTSQENIKLLRECFARNTPTSLDKPPVERLLSYVPRTFVNCLNSEFIQKTFGRNECGRRHFQVGDKVLFTRVIQNRRKWFKAQVIRRLGYNVYLVKNLKGTFKVHVNQMRTGSDTKYAEDSDWTLDNAGAGPHRLEQDPQISTSPPPRRSTRPRCPPCRLTNKLKIVDPLKNSASGSSLARKYGDGNATISDIQKNSDAITNYASALDNEDGKINLKKAVYTAAEAWTTLKDTTLAKSWNKLLPSEESITASEELPNSQFVSELAELITTSTVFEECDQKDIQDWLECDVDGYQLLTEDEIIESVVDDQGSSDKEKELRDDDQGREPILQPLPQRIEMEDDHRPTVSGSYLPCQRQRDPSTFSGDGNINPGQWLKEYERVSKYNRWDETMKLANVVFYLNGTAGRWFDNNEESLNSWRSFEDAFRGVFGLQEDSARRAEEVLKSRAQKAEESSESYIQEILSLCHQVNPRMEEGEVVAHIIKGISEDTYQVLVAKDIQTVDEILKFCRHLTTVKQRRIGRTKFARLSNVMPISCVDDSDDLAGLIRRIVREEIQKVFSAPEVVNPLREVNALEQTVREEVSRALQPTRPQVNVVQQQPRTPYYNIDRPTQPRKTEHWRTYDDKPICFHCGRPGYVVRYCRERRQVFAEARSRNGGEERNVGFSSRPPRYDADDDYVTPQTSTYFYRSSSPHPSRARSPARRQSQSPARRFSRSPKPQNISFEFVVMVECSHDIIFGWDFFKATEAVIDCGRNELHLGETSVLESREEENQRLFASDDFVIPPKSIKKISVINEEVCGVRDVLVSTSKDLLLRKEILIPNSLVTFRHGRGNIWVANGASWPQLIPSGMNMCTMESYENGNICSLIESSDKLQETQLKSREWSQKLNLTLDPGLSEIQRLQLVSCLDEFIDKFDFGGTPIKPTSTVKHKINTGDHSPIKQRPYRVAPSERRLIQDEVNKMIENHIVKPSESPWSSPVILVRKKDGTWRFCVDYRRLNKITKKDVYPLPRIDDALDSLAGSSYFSTMDLRSGYWQIEVDEKDREKTAFITPDGLYEFRVMPFGLCNAPATRIKILGHLVDANGIHPDPEKVEAVSKFPRPKNISELRSFLGLCSYYRRFIENFADKARSLHDLLKTEKQFYWDAAQEKAFEVLKTALISEPVLGHFDESADTHLHTDASGHGIGAVLLQIQGGKERPIAYASRSLTKAEHNYSTTEKECLAVVWSISKFRPYLFGRPFTVVTDHHSLCWLVGQKDPSGRLARWALKLQEFDVTVIYKSGRKHKDADCLSRSPLENDQPSAVMSLTNVDIEQTKDPDLAKIIDNIYSGYTRSEFSIIDGILYKKNYSTTGRPWLMMIPKHLRSEVMADLHDAPTAGHLGFAR